MKSERLPATVILSRPDAMGDTVLTLPMTGLLKRAAPEVRVVAIARNYTRAIWHRCKNVDEVLTLEDLTATGRDGAIAQLASLEAGAIIHAFYDHQLATWAKEARIPLRVGNGRRLRHWRTCNLLPQVAGRREKLHESERCAGLLRPFLTSIPDRLDDMWSLMGLSDAGPSDHCDKMSRPDQWRLVLHPMTASGRAWGLDKFAALIEALDPERYHCIVTGSHEEALQYRPHLPLRRSNVEDLGGSLDLDGLIRLIAHSDALVAGSTGPLHLAAALGRVAIGLYPASDIVHRWRPIGPKAEAITFDAACSRCARGKECDCIGRISPATVKDRLEALLVRPHVEATDL